MCDSADEYVAPIELKPTDQASLEFWRTQAQASQASIAELTARLRLRDRHIVLLQLAISRTLVMNHVWSTHLERKLERMPPRHTTHRAPTDSMVKQDRSVIVRLPHLTQTLEALFEVMREHWSDWEPDRPPKSSTVARAIDERLGLKGQSNGEASRNAQTFAAALRPDSVTESDGRHR